MLDNRSSFDSEGYYDSSSDYGGANLSIATQMTKYSLASSSTTMHHHHHHSTPNRTPSPSAANCRPLLCELQPLHPGSLPISHHHCPCCNYRGTFPLVPITAPSHSVDPRHVIYIGSRDAMAYYYPNLATTVDAGIDCFQDVSSHGPPHHWGYPTATVIHHPNPYYQQLMYGAHNVSYGYPPTHCNATVPANTTHLPSYQLMNKYYPPSSVIKFIDSGNDSGADMFDETESGGPTDNHHQAFCTIPYY